MLSRAEKEDGASEEENRGSTGLSGEGEGWRTRTTVCALKIALKSGGLVLRPLIMIVIVVVLGVDSRRTTTQEGIGGEGGGSAVLHGQTVYLLEGQSE